MGVIASNGLSERLNNGGSIVWRLIATMLLCVIAAPACAQELVELEPRDVGWTMTRLDMIVRIERDDPSMVVKGTMTLRLDLDRSSGPTLGINGRQAAMRWTSLVGPDDAHVELNVQSPQSKAERSM
jgi:hypothetical protein